MGRKYTRVKSYIRRSGDWSEEGEDYEEEEEDDDDEDIDLNDDIDANNIKIGW